MSEIGFGGWGIGGTIGQAVGYGSTDDGESLAALKRAYEKGVTFYDTADLYGYGHSERLIGRAFRDVRGKVVIASKGGRTDPNGGQDFSVTHLDRALEGTLLRLQTDYLDLYQLHDPPLTVLQSCEEPFSFLDRLRRSGRVRAVGISLRSPEEGAEALKRYGFQSVQSNFSMLDQRVLQNGLLELCRVSGVGFIARTPLCFGFLTGAVGGDTAFQKGDHRIRWSVEQRTRWAEAARQFFTSLEEVGQTPAQMALRFCLSYEGVSAAIPGILTVGHADENTAASELGPLREERRRFIEKAYDRQEVFLGRGGEGKEQRVLSE